MNMRYPSASDTKANSVLGCIRKTITSRLRVMTLPLSTGKTYLECWVQVWIPHYKTDVDIPESGQEDD